MFRIQKTCSAILISTNSCQRASRLVGENEEAIFLTTHVVGLVDNVALVASVKTPRTTFRFLGEVCCWPRVMDRNSCMQGTLPLQHERYQEG